MEHKSLWKPSSWANTGHAFDVALLKKFRRECRGFSQGSSCDGQIIQSTRVRPALLAIAEQDSYNHDRTEFTALESLLASNGLNSFSSRVVATLLCAAVLGLAQTPVHCQATADAKPSG